MKPLAECLASYAEYHRDRRNIATHALGLPMIPRRPYTSWLPLMGPQRSPAQGTRL